MAELMPVGQFSTMFYGVIDINEDHLQYSSAASPGGLILKKNGRIEILNGTGFPLGVNMDAEYDIYKVPYKQGDAIILYSDALIETADEKGNFLTQADLNEVLYESRSSSAQSMIDNILARFRDHVGNRPFVDDLTINIYKRL
jgi:sigma-B regulation protein RsbU (phosphoserine phosphatase)